VRAHLKHDFAWLSIVVSPNSDPGQSGFVRDRLVLAVIDIAKRKLALRFELEVPESNQVSRVAVWSQRRHRGEILHVDHGDREAVSRHSARLPLEGRWHSELLTADQHQDRVGWLDHSTHVTIVPEMLRADTLSDGALCAA
jgi:hypothetical protein